jgi:hypothetical protein
MTKRSVPVLGIALAFAVACAFTVTSDEVSQAQEVAPPIGFTPISRTTFNRRGCATCPLIVNVPTRFQIFALGTDSAYPISLTGKVDVSCKDGSTYNVYMRSPTSAGLFQVIPNLCVNFDTFALKVSVDSASLSPQDVERTVTLTVYGRLS